MCWLLSTVSSLILFSLIVCSRCVESILVTLVIIVQRKWFHQMGFTNVSLFVHTMPLVHRKHSWICNHKRHFIKASLGNELQWLKLPRADSAIIYKMFFVFFPPQLHLSNRLGSCSTACIQCYTVKWHNSVREGSLNTIVVTQTAEENSTFLTNG